VRFGSFRKGDSIMSRFSVLATLSAAVAAATAFGDVSYQSADTLSTGSGAQDASAVATGDVNGDGFVDLIIANRGGSANIDDGSVVVLLGDGGGNFAAAQKIHDGSIVRPIALAVVDLDGDSDLDIAAVTLGTDGVLFFFNAGNGTFPDQDAQGAGNAPAAIAIGDFNDDGDPDVLVSNSEDDSVTLLLNNGGNPPQFPESGGPIDVSVPAQITKPQGVAAGDFDGDGALDAAVVLLDRDQVAILVGDGAGAFDTDFVRVDVGTTATGDADPLSIVAADFDGDNDVDLAVTNSVGDSVTILKNNGSGTFSNGGDFAAGNGPRGVIAADLDGDGELDLAVANFEGDEVSVLTGNGDGTFDAPRSFKVGSGPFGVAAGNFDRTGQLDLASANQESDNASVLLAGAATSDPSDTDDPLPSDECAALNCGPLAMMPIALTMLGIAAMKLSGRRTRQ
jgi:hypothetical protein